MVRFDKNKIIIEVESINPVRDWMDIYWDLFDLLQCQKVDEVPLSYNVYQLLKAMLPDDNICTQLNTFILKEKADKI